MGHSSAIFGTMIKLRGAFQLPMKSSSFWVSNVIFLEIDFLQLSVYEIANLLAVKQRNLNLHLNSAWYSY